MVTWPSVVSVIETGVGNVDVGVSVTVLVLVERTLCSLPGLPRPVEDSVTEACENGMTGDGVLDTVTEALLGTAGLAGETALGKFGNPDAVGEESEGHIVVWAGTKMGGEETLDFTTAELVLDEAGDNDDSAGVGGEDSGVAGGPDEMTRRPEGFTGKTRVDRFTGTPDDLDETGCGDDVVDTVEMLVSLVSDMFNAWSLALEEGPLVGVRLVDGVVVGVAGGWTQRP